MISERENYSLLRPFGIMSSTLLSMAALWLRRSSKCFSHVALISVLPFRMDAPSLQRGLSMCRGAVDRFHGIHENFWCHCHLLATGFHEFFTAGCPLNGGLTFLVGLALGGTLGIILETEGGFSFDQLFKSFIVFIKSVLMFLLLATDDFLAISDHGLF